MSAGACIGKKKAKTKPRVYVTPCNVASKGIQIRLSSDYLDAKLIKPELENAFLDDFSSPSSSKMSASHTIDCYWGKNVGERREYYYCAGYYMAPELDARGVIQRHLWREYKVGFKVEEHNIGSWVDSSGTLHDEGNVYYLTIKETEAKCYVAWDSEVALYF
ncbi:MAG: hypothetical protein GF416_03190 [Candidatus Altiarchaeales archaeon]|nr:hypothetical protein [Candidatus Altiarchaeales archaeon]